MAGVGDDEVGVPGEGVGSGDLAEGAAHKFICPRCGADSSRPEDTFVVHAGAVVPRSDYMLMETECRGCGLFRDVALWCGASEMAFGDEMRDAASMALLGRFEALAEMHRRALLRVEPTAAGPACHLDHEAEPVQFTRLPLVAIGADLLAAARGLRRALVHRPGAGHIGLVRAGHLTATASLHATPEGPASHALHLGVSNRHAPLGLTEGEMEFLISLFFTPEERPHLSVFAGQRWPMLHICLATDPAGVLAC